jgi:tryptophan synthase alpha chain
VSVLFRYDFSRASLPATGAADLAVLRSQSRVPVVVGFGISRPEHVATLNGSADGVVVGSAIVAVIGEETDDSRRVEAVRTLVQALRAAMVT